VTNDFSVCVCMYVTRALYLNEQPHKDAIQCCRPSLQGKCTHGDIDLICLLFRLWVIGRSTFTVTNIALHGGRLVLG